VESVGIRSKGSGQARATGITSSGSGTTYKAQACCPRLEGLVPGSETEVSTYLGTAQ